MAVRTRAVTRRRMIGAGAALATTKVARRQALAGQDGELSGSALRVLLPEHPLSGWTDAVRNLAMTWGQQHGVTVELDVIPKIDLDATVDTELEIGVGHDLIGTDIPLLHHADAFRDMAALADAVVEQFGAPTDVCDAATLMADGRRPAFSIAYGPAPLIYRRSVWEAYGLPDGPSTWEQLHSAGAQIWNGEGMNLGFGLSPEPGSERFALMLISAYGGAMQDVDGQIVLDSPATVAAVEFAVHLYHDAMSPESLDWAPGRQVDLLRNGIASIVCDDISAIRLIQGQNQEIANDLFLAPPPARSATDGMGASPATTYRTFHIPSFSTQADAAEAFLLVLVASSDVLVGGSQLAERPAYASMAPELVQTGGWLDIDPYGAMPPEKLALLKSSAAWTIHPASPAPANAIASLAHGEFLLARMLASAVRGERTPEEAVSDAETRLREIARIEAE